MDRRGFLKVLSAAPVAAVAGVAVVTTEKSVAAEGLPMGFIKDVWERPENDAFDEAYHGSIAINFVDGRNVLLRRKIWDGRRFVDLNSPAGAAVLNAVVQRRA